jgi:hypothetical protein
VKLLHLSVAGKEQVQVPAGTFNAFRVEISSADGGADKKTHLDCRGNAQSSEGYRGSGFHGRICDDPGTGAVDKVAASGTMSL